MPDQPPQYLVERTYRAASSEPRGGSAISGQKVQPSVIRINVEQPAADWVRDALDEIEELTKLPQGWDGYDGATISATAAISAVTFLLNTGYPELPPPEIVPSAEGSVQIEWHNGGIDLEVYFAPDGLRGYLQDHESGEEAQLGTDEVRGELLQLLPRLRGD